ncbi:RCC1 domain-containing protein [Corallococcus carmarthensis]|uniref:RTX toxin n=1 Tax=Corallococcus carmarthensis TaxID=2316728 RepID=A0A3A8KHM9_9BACT|nr:RTX toxin [Corallococcus carmarthensis]RKH03711.1 RTX toxin [Corallococcus carmarthensis]
MKRTSPRWSRGVLGALLLSLSSPWIAACSSGTSAQEPSAPSEQTQSQVTVSIGAQDIFAEAVKKGRVSALAFSYADVKSIRIDVSEQGAGGLVIFKNFDLFTSAGAWTGKLPFLPKAKALTFFARALDASGNPLFSGTLDATLNLDFETVTIPLAPSTNGAQISIPRIRKISIPSAFASAQSGNITFFVEANVGEALTYSISSSATGSGAFSPPNGGITLLNTAGAFVSQYSPPTVATETVFSHTVTATNAAGHSISTTFTTKVMPPETTNGVIDTSVAVLFNPVINGLNAQRTGTNVKFSATVADDTPEEALTYAWTFTPSTGTTPDPLPEFTTQTNPTTLQHYATTLQGDLKLSVTDTNNGTTTLNYKLTPDQFPDEPVAQGPLDGISTLRGGSNHTCAMLNDGSVRCWGYGAYGQLGYASTSNWGNTQARLPYLAGPVGILGKATKLATGGDHSCVLLDSGLVRCWGRNDFGQLGYNTTQNLGDGEAVTEFGYVNLGGPAIRLSAGKDHTCAVMDTGKVRCWGRNNAGQLGYGHTDTIGDNEQPWQAGDVDLGNNTATDVAAGENHTCALLSTGRLLCWGKNTYGQLGYPHLQAVGASLKPGSQTPVEPTGLVAQVSVDRNATCALLRSGSVVCWGNNYLGQVGSGGGGTQIGVCEYSQPWAITCYVKYLGNPGTTAVDFGGVTALQVSSGNDHSCALLSTGDVRCWGSNSAYQLGNTGGTAVVPAASVELGGSTAYQVSVGDNHSCALLSTGKARCWGLGSQGQLGYGATTNVASPTADIQLLPPTP